MSTSILQELQKLLEREYIDEDGTCKTGAAILAERIFLKAAQGEMWAIREIIKRTASIVPMAEEDTEHVQGAPNQIAEAILLLIGKKCGAVNEEAYQAASCQQKESPNSSPLHEQDDALQLQCG